jgi:predicted acyltransferase
MTTPITTPAIPRIVSIDAMRGATIAFMIIVNTPGDWDNVWPFLQHAAWNGCRPADFVFPFFLFLMGCVIPFALDRRLASGESRIMLAGHIMRRVFLLIALKLLLSAYPHFHLGHLRLFGVLTRIALCYGLVALLYMVTRKTMILLMIIGIILFAWWIMLCLLPVPGIGLPGRDIPLFDPEANLAAWLDRIISHWMLNTLHTGVLYEKTWDPEGFLGTFPACASVLSGVLAGQLFRNRALPAKQRIALLLGAGSISLVAGLLWSYTTPINKALWSSPFVLVTSGTALLLLALFDWMFDIRRFQDRNRITGHVLSFLSILGTNAIVAFLLSGFVVKTLMFIPAPSTMPGSLYGFLYSNLFLSWLPFPNLASCLFSLVFLATMTVPLAVLHRRNIIIRL